MLRAEQSYSDVEYAKVMGIINRMEEEQHSWNGMLEAQEKKRGR